MYEVASACHYRFRTKERDWEMSSCYYIFVTAVTVTVVTKYKRMKRAIKALAFTQVDDYFGEFHTVESASQRGDDNTQIAVG